MAALMSCTNPFVFYCIFLSFACGGRSATLLMDHGTMFCLMFGRTRATRPPRKMRERMRQCVRCVVTSAPPSQFMVSVRDTIVVNVLTPTLVGLIVLFIEDIVNDILWC